jgi:hypothetical protein
MVSPGHARGASIPLRWFLKIYLLCLLQRPRGSALPARAAVRLLRTRRPARQLYVKGKYGQGLGFRV